MRVFNKYAALNKLDNKNNNKTKKRTIIVCVVVLIFAILYFSFARFESNKKYSIINGNIGNFNVKLSSKMISLANNGSSGIDYDGVDVLGEYGTSDNNIRYYGPNPNNYVYFNCSATNPEEMNETTCEKWRIVGLFNNIEDENGNNASRVKIIREESLGSYSWDSSDSTVNSGFGINQWGSSGTYEGADLMRELNTDYLGNITVGTDGKWYNGSNNSKTADMPTTTLNQNAQNMIQEVKWNLGSPSNDSGVYNNNRKTSVSYIRERENNNGKICQSGTYCTDEVERTTMWTGKVGLIYPSDYGYSTSGGASSRNTCLYDSMGTWRLNSNCYRNTWIYSVTYQWTLSPQADEDDNASVCMIYQGNMDNFSAYLAYFVRPVVFLKLNIKIYDGDGSSTNPYKIYLPVER
ncbi:MAG: hypothetical protein E7159_01745 [Firmicutes bacterium]|nr:hypothetical protein [Bacillota bacterium]